MTRLRLQPQELAKPTNFSQQRFARVARTQRRAARRLEFKGPNQFFSQHRAVDLKSLRVGEAVWGRVWKIFTRVMAQEKGIFALRD